MGVNRKRSEESKVSAHVLSFLREMAKSLEDRESKTAAWQSSSARSSGCELAVASLFAIGLPLAH